MVRIVKKFGGTSIGDTDRIRSAAAKIAAAHATGDEVAVVVSAMADMTDRLTESCEKICAAPDPAEFDVVASAGEQITAGLMVMALQEAGLKSRSWTGWQVPIRTDTSHSDARIEKVDCEKLEACLGRGEVPVITGFQGLTSDGRIATLGRGGSDLTAIAVAAALSADRCDIYTDVPGIYTADPNIVRGVRKLADIGYDEMVLLSRYGAGVLQGRAVESAHELGVRVQVRSSFERQSGTVLAVDPARDAEADGSPFNPAKAVCGIAHKSLVDEGEAGTITLPEAETLVVISAIGAGIAPGCGLMDKGTEALVSAGVPVIEASEAKMRVRIVIAQDKLSLALGVLHSAYGLSEN